MLQVFPAATVMLLRNGPQGIETLLLRRSEAVSFASGQWVFPGGKIDQADYGDNYEDIDSAARQAAVRETLEETGLEIGVNAMSYFSHWTTPPLLPKRYATWFFVAAVEGCDDVTVDGVEILAHRWYCPCQALADHHANTIAMMLPTVMTLSLLSDCHTVDAGLAMLSAEQHKRSQLKLMPRFTLIGNRMAMLSSQENREISQKAIVDDDDDCTFLCENWR
jgi:8-oxo-dGTP pyrophosphatase MutT (NUDIX family)